MRNFRQKGQKYIIGVLIVAILVAFLLPVVITPFNEDSEVTYAQSTSDDPVEVTANLEGDLTAVSAAGGTIDVTLNDSGTTSSVTSVAEGDNATTTINGETITITNVNASSTTNATVKYAYPTNYGWGSGTSNLWTLLPLLFILGVFLFFVKKTT